MRLNYKFSNLCGVVYKKGNLVYTTDGRGLYSAVGRRVTHFDLTENTSTTFPFELPTNVQRIAVSPDGMLLVAVDTTGQAVVVSIPHRIALHYVNFRTAVTAMTFSPDGTKLAVATDGRVRIWRTPSGQREFASLVLEKTMGGHTEEIVSFDWSSDSRYLLTASHDMTARLLDLRRDEENPQFVPIELRAHRHPLCGAYFAHKDQQVVTVARNGSLFIWKFDPVRGTMEERMPTIRHHLLQESNEQEENATASNTPSLSFRTKVTAVDYNKENHLLVVTFSNGVFSIFVIPSCSMAFITDTTTSADMATPTATTPIYTLSLTQSKVTSVAINATGEWIALGIAEHGQLLVWEWRSESFILKQQGHALAMTSLDYSPDGQTIVTGSADGRVKLWHASSGLCYATFAEHTASVTAVEFSAKSGKIVVSAASDGTVRAYDMLRYRNFRTFTTPTPVQFMSLAIDPSGEVVAAGTFDTFEIFLWSMQTGQLLEIIAGHTAPISALSFDPLGHRLASASWDRTVRLWDVFQRDKNMQSLDHSAEVTAVTFRPDGAEVVACTLAGEIVTWDVELATVTGVIEARRDVADKPLTSCALKSVCYSPDGTWLLVSGSFPFIALYDVANKVLLRRYPLTKMRRGQSVEMNVPSVKMAPTNRAFAALSPDGLVIHSLDEQLIFDPFDLELDITSENIQTALVSGEHLKAFIMALRLNIPKVTEHVIVSIPVNVLSLLVRGIPQKYLLSTLHALTLLAPHRVELLLRWVVAVLAEHTLTIKSLGRCETVLRVLLGKVKADYEVLGRVANQTIFMLECRSLVEIS
ncbi:hypothetical protein PSACC_01201 [Paramicrosporidium saccamoebae]|uniref:Small-subunit processome Utp12 domain-containing protein n=1 Tax=Paramicrosporidium saccamoebae TaxID=1246581 RepID=A0A2H9TMI8_9FUNG|nr:hypothetical protein PSACC_01201 [Paramicrosporidium saccamoebae]